MAKDSRVSGCCIKSGLFIPDHLQIPSNSWCLSCPLSPASAYCNLPAQQCNSLEASRTQASLPSCNIPGHLEEFTGPHSHQPLNTASSQPLLAHQPALYEAASFLLSEANLPAAACHIPPKAPPSSSMPKWRPSPFPTHQEEVVSRVYSDWGIYRCHL
jgi:hypothetical protein